MRSNAITLTASATLISLLAGAASADYKKTWDYQGNLRNLALNFMADADTHAVHQPVGAIEPDPSADGIFTISDSVRRAAASWNAAGTGWTMGFMPAAGWITIDVRMGKIDPDDPTKNEFTPPSSEYGDNDGEDGGAGGGNTLAYFRITGTDPNDGRFATSAEIVFNNFVDWGIGTNAAAREDMRYDPIIVALHEIGHALRLDHTTPGGSTTIGMPRDGHVMRPRTQSGWHRTNKNVMFDRNPHAADMGFAAMSAGDKLPAPGAAALTGLGGLLIARRRRA
ncbi:MAG: hypothetical protein IT435_13700 [Phycisphaerales bacterium]|nr:hypothetical protein [Phycisphaerales bacterium]